MLQLLLVILVAMELFEPEQTQAVADVLACLHAENEAKWNRLVVSPSTPRIAASGGFPMIALSATSPCGVHRACKANRVIVTV